MALHLAVKAMEAVMEEVLRELRQLREEVAELRKLVAQPQTVTHIHQNNPWMPVPAANPPQGVPYYQPPYLITS